MKRRQLAAIALSAILSFSACIPAAGVGVYAAENDANPDYVAEETIEVGDSDEIAEAAGQAGESAQDSAEGVLDVLSEDSAEQTDESAQDNSEEALDVLPGEVLAGTDAVGEADAEETAADAEMGSGNETVSGAEAVSGDEAADAAPADSGAAVQEETSADEGAAAQQEASADEGAALQEEISADEEENTLIDGSGTAQDDAQDLAQDEAQDLAQDEAQDAAQDDLEAVTEEDGSQEEVGEKAAGGPVEAVENDFAGAAEIAVGDVVDVNITADSPAFFRLTPSESGRYKIYSSGSGCDPAMYLYDAEYNIIDAFDDNIEGGHFKFSGDLEADTTYYIQTYCYDEQAAYQLHFERLYFYAQAVDGITEFNLDKGASQTLTVTAGAAEGEEITYSWHDVDGSELMSDEADPASCTVEDVQSFTQIYCTVEDQSGNCEDVWFILNVNGVISAWPDGEASNVRSRSIAVERGDTQVLSVYVRTDVEEYSIVWYDENDQVIQDDNNPSYELSNIQQARTIRCRVADLNDPDNYEDVFFQIRIYIEYYVYPEGNDRDNLETNIDISEQDSVTLRTMVETTGSTEGITYKWEVKKYGEEEWTEIPDIQGDTYEISMPRKANYRCTATDAEGNTGTAAFELYLEFDNGMDLYGFDKEGTEIRGGEYVYDADDTDSPIELRIGVEIGVGDRLSYQWYKDSGDGEEVIEGAVDSSFTVDNPVNGTRYICVVDDGYGNETREFIYSFRHYNDLLVYTDDTESTSSVQLDPREAESFTLSPYVTAEDMEGLTYEWQMCHNDDGMYAATGDTSSSLTVSSPAHNDNYKCIVTDSYGNTAEALYMFRADNHLSLYAAGDITKREYFYIDITGKETLTLNAVAEADEGTPLTYHWEKRDEYAEQHIIDGASGELTGGGPITLQADELMAGTAYYCYLTDNYCEKILAFELRTESPSWSIHPKGASEGEDTAIVNLDYYSTETSLFVDYEGDTENLYFTWRDENGGILQSGLFCDYYSASEIEDGSRYSCTVTDPYGQEATVWFELHIGRHPNAPTEEEIAAAQVISAGDTTVVQAEADSRGAFLAFTPEESGNYIIYSSRNETQGYDPYVELYSQSGVLLAEDNENKGNGDFLIMRNLVAGKTYYLRAQDCYQQEFSYSVHVEKTDFYACPGYRSNMTAYIDESCYLYVNSWSTTSLSYQWYKGDADGAEDSFEPVSGATEHDYSPVIKEDCSFMCRVSDEAGHSKDVVIYITAEINREPKNSDFENAEEIGSGDSRDITLTEDHFAEVFKYTAEKSGGRHFYVNSGDEDFYGLVQVFVKESDEESEYYNFVTSGSDFDYDMAAGDTVYLRVLDNEYRPGSCTLHVESVPIRAEAVTDTSITARKGEQITFGVRAQSSDSEVHYQWYEETYLYSDDYMPIEGAVADSYTFAAQKDIGMKCTVTDDSGNSDTVYFTVYLSYEPVEEDFAGASVIEAGDTLQVDLDPDHYAKFFKFVPEKTGAYTISYTRDENTFEGTLLDVYDSEHILLPTDKHFDVYPDHLSSFLGREGETYYIRAASEDHDRTGSYILSLTECTELCAYGPDGYKTIYPGEEISFEVTAWSSSALHYQWFYSTEEAYYSEDHEEDPSEIQGAADASYTPASPKSGLYICKVRDDDGHSKDVVFPLKVENSLCYDGFDVPWNDYQYGESAILEAGASAADTEGLQFRWQKYDEAGDAWVDIEGATASSYTIPEVVKRAEYQVIITDKYNNTCCRNFTVGIENHFSATYVRHEEDANESVVYDELTLTLTANQSHNSLLEVAVEGTDTEGVTYEWGCKSGDQSTITLEEKTSKCTPQYDGYYFCEVTDKYGNEREVTFRVIIENDLKFTRTEDTDLETRGSRPVTLKAYASALNTESIRYLWYKDVNYDTIFLGETSENYFEVVPESEYERYFCCLTDIYRHYDDSSQVYFNITKIPGIDLSDAEITVAADGLTYDGKAKTPAVTVKYGGNTLTAGTDYEVAYTGNTDAGTDTGKVTVTGIGDYEGTVEKTFSIAKASQSLQAEDLSVAFSETAAISVTGAKGKMTFTSDAPEVAAVDADGNVTGKKVGSARIKISAAGNNNFLPAEKEITVTVTSAELKAENVTVAANGLTYNGKAQKPAVTVKYGGKTLAENTDYKVSYKNNTNAGTNTAEVTITGMGNFKASVIKKFSIAKAAQKLTASAVKTPVGKTATISVSGAKGTKTFKSANSTIAAVNSKTGVVTGKKVGTVKITVTSAASSNYKAASKTVTATVLPAATTKITAENLATGIKVTWNKVAGANGYILYRNNAKIATLSGNAKVTYTDSKANTNGTKYTYKVVAKASTGTSTLSKSLATYRLARPAVSSLTNSAAGKMTVKWAKNAKATGYQIQYTTDSGFKSGVKTVKITKAATVSTVIAKLTKTKTYHVRMRTYKTVGSTSYYSTWSASKRLKITK